MFDRRNLTSNGVGSPIYKFEGHKAAVLCVQVLMNLLVFFFLKSHTVYFLWGISVVQTGSLKLLLLLKYVSCSSGLRTSHLSLEVLQRMVSWTSGIMRRWKFLNCTYLSLIAVMSLGLHRSFLSSSQIWTCLSFVCRSCHFATVDIGYVR